MLRGCYTIGWCSMVWKEQKQVNQQSSHTHYAWHTSDAQCGRSELCICIVNTEARKDVLVPYVVMLLWEQRQYCGTKNQKEGHIEDAPVGVKQPASQREGSPRCARPAETTHTITIPYITITLPKNRRQTKEKQVCYHLQAEIHPIQLKTIYGKYIDIYSYNINKSCTNINNNVRSLSKVKWYVKNNSYKLGEERRRFMPFLLLSDFLLESAALPLCLCRRVSNWRLP